MTATQDTLNSSYREMLIEHLFVGEVMRHLWLRQITQFEVLKPQVDDSGYDLVLEANGILRHVQLKASSTEASTAKVTANLALARKPSGCVIWVRFNPKTIELGPFLWFGAGPGQPLPDIQGFPVTRHAKANAQGMKLLRKNLRDVTRSRFECVTSMDALVTQLFGQFVDPVAAV